MFILKKGNEIFSSGNRLIYVGQYFGSGLRRRVVHWTWLSHQKRWNGKETIYNLVFFSGWLLAFLLLLQKLLLWLFTKIILCNLHNLFYHLAHVKSEVLLVTYLIEMVMWVNSKNMFKLHERKFAASFLKQFSDHYICIASFRCPQHKKWSIIVVYFASSFQPSVLSFLFCLFASYLVCDVGDNVARF